MHPIKYGERKKQQAVEYILRFAGFIETEAEISRVSKAVMGTGQFNSPNQEYSIRLVVISENKLNKNWRHLANISIENIIDFIVDVRGQCWVEQNKGIASIHYQWNKLINDIFEIANNMTVSTVERKEEIRRLLREN